MLRYDIKSINLVGACAVVAVVIGTALAPASSASAEGSGATGLTLVAPFPGSMGPTATPFGSPGSLLAREIAVLTRRGISPARAGEDMEVLGKAEHMRLVRKLWASLSSAYAGVWFEPAAAQLHIGVISRASRRAAEGVAARAGLAGDVTMTPVRSTWAQLLATQNRWNRRLANLFARAEVKTALAPQRNAVTVTLSSSVPARERAVLGHEASTGSVNVLVTVVPDPQLSIRDAAETKCNLFMENKAYCDKPITPGVTLQSEKLRRAKICSAGPLAIPKADKNRTYLLTAGHCIQDVRRMPGASPTPKWYAYNTKPEKAEIGRSAQYLKNANADVGAIKVNNPGKWVVEGNPPVYAVTAEWGKKEEKSFPVKGEGGPPMVGAPNCVEGQTSGGTCGVVGTLGVTVTGTGGLVEDEEGAVAWRGDSGGAVIMETKSEYLAEGTIVGFKSGTYAAIWEPLETAFKELNRLNLELLTTANEVRPKESGTEKEVNKNFEKLEKEEEEGLYKETKAEEELAEKELKEEEEEKSGAWEKCSEGGPDTKYSDNQCTKAVEAGKWQWNEVPTTEKIRSSAMTLRLEDEKTAVGKSTIQCGHFEQKESGAVGPVKKGKITAAKVKEPKTECERIEGGCEAGKIEAVNGVNLPWKTENFETEKKVLTKIGATTSGKEPGWEVKCKTILGPKTDTCTTESGKPEELKLENKATKNGSVMESLVLATFEKKHKSDCTEGGKESGVVSGQIAILKENGPGLGVL